MKNNNNNSNSSNKKPQPKPSNVNPLTNVQTSKPTTVNRNYEANNAVKKK